MSRKTKRVVFMCFAFALPHYISAQSESFKKIRLSEGVLREKATKTIVPVFPDEAIKKRATGVAVVEIQIDQKGHVTSATVLEAPDSSIGTLLMDAVRHWEFKPTTVGGEPVLVVGKITFYYVLDHGKGVVLTPNEMAERRAKATSGR